jgi:hypothetical protein
MLTDRVVILSVLIAAVMSVVLGASTWFVYFRYRQCMKHLDTRESPAVVRQDIASITFDAMMTIAWGILTGAAIGSLAKEVRWIEIALMTCALGSVGFFSVQPLRHLVLRSTQDSWR